MANKSRPYFTHDTRVPPGTVKGENTVIMRPDEFRDFNCMYRGAKPWRDKQTSLGPEITA
ncbi:hypothetical protein N7478_003911 [Penicillium angulare]|uniref:uncharacterized protein n=1 Tax=Penicillium angulare TaxID=116970 RepID=UPI0025407742|nr:uncharacterized protein N7478_003911 [Penicillium angulare]KAJ5288225.1 hypothetical protein N7478_003911 [Penicillium angulare]